MENTAALLSELVNRSDLLFFVYDPVEKQMIFSNPATRKILNSWGLSSARPKQLFFCIHPDHREAFSKAYLSVLDGGPTAKVQLKFMPHPGAERWIWLSFTFFLCTGFLSRACIAGYAEEITSIREDAEVTKRYMKSKNTVLTILTHDLSGPLGSIQNLATLISKQAKRRDDQDSIRFAGMIDRISRQSIALIKDFINADFIERGKISLSKKTVNICPVIREAVQHYQGFEPGGSERFRFNCSGDEIYASIDTNKFLHLLNNLLSNAIKFTPEDGSVTTSVEHTVNGVVISVADTGVGIPAKYHSGLFGEFNGASRPGLNGEPSIGLGMSIIKTITDWHNGTVSFESEEGVGTTFHVFLPGVTDGAVN